MLLALSKHWRTRFAQGHCAMIMEHTQSDYEPDPVRQRKHQAEGVELRLYRRIAVHGGNLLSLQLHPQISMKGTGMERVSLPVVPNGRLCSSCARRVL